MKIFGTECERTGACNTSAGVGAGHMVEYDVWSTKVNTEKVTRVEGEIPAMTLTPAE